jgi:hypothetical protein
MRPYADTNFFTRYYLEMAESPIVTRTTKGTRCRHSSTGTTRFSMM